ncbi:Dynein alpha chain, flagellar outer arm [Grifola frondosa]|uniref:Dynein alpha chain, flagellar outer arm n=1 Tax=Grifola frondosa TaxID=5627 RepID=A0A1C7MHK8_GRIFR|nr:Dynein alpha chain, flagellar outer arm [Grifola frondosa]
MAPSTEIKAAADSSRAASLSDVPEEGPMMSGLRSPYFHPSGSTSATTFKPAASTSSLASASSSSKPMPSPRHPSALVRSSTSRPPSEAGLSITNGVSSRNRPRSGSPATVKEREKEKDGVRERDRDKEKEKEKEKEGKSVRPAAPPTHRLRNTPHLPHAKDVEPTPATLMHWSRAPVYGTLPLHGVRAHTVTLVDSMAWMFGGCAERDSWRDVFCLNTGASSFSALRALELFLNAGGSAETMQWTHPEMLGDIPPPCRAHTATLVDRRIVVFGGGETSVYYNDTYVLDTVMRRWVRPVFADEPPPRRAHTAVLYRNKIWIFGGGNGLEALNDVWTLEVGGPIERMRWEHVETRGKKPTPRGYHTANLIGNVMVVVGGSDGRECFSDIWCLNLGAHLAVVRSTRSVPAALTYGDAGRLIPFIIGGHDGSQYTNELLLFNLVSLQYEPRPVAGKPPSPRGYHTAFLADGRIFLIGGYNGAEAYDDVHLLDLAGAAYLPQVTSFRIDVD